MIKAEHIRESLNESSDTEKIPVWAESAKKHIQVGHLAKSGDKVDLYIFKGVLEDGDDTGLNYDTDKKPEVSKTWPVYYWGVNNIYKNGYAMGWDPSKPQKVRTYQKVPNFLQKTSAPAEGYVLMGDKAYKELEAKHVWWHPATKDQ